MDALYESLRTYVDENERGDMIYISKVNDIIYIRFSSDLFLSLTVMFCAAPVMIPCLLSEMR